MQDVCARRRRDQRLSRRRYHLSAFERGKQVAPAENSVLSGALGQTLLDKNLHPPALGVDDRLAEPALDRLNPVASGPVAGQARSPRLS